jgi:small subunit ribosomal protein S10
MPESSKTTTKKKGAKRVKKTETEEVVQRLRIRVRAYEHKILDASVKQIIDTTQRLDAKIVGPVPLPTEIKRYTVNRASFIFKDAREQFEMRVHKRVIDILNPSQKVIEALTNINLPSGVNIDVKML